MCGLDCWLWCLIMKSSIEVSEIVLFIKLLQATSQGEEWSPLYFTSVDLGACSHLQTNKACNFEINIWQQYCFLIIFYMKPHIIMSVLRVERTCLVWWFLFSAAMLVTIVVGGRSNTDHTESSSADDTNTTALHQQHHLTQCGTGELLSSAGDCLTGVSVGWRISVLSYHCHHSGRCAPAVNTAVRESCSETAVRYCDHIC